MANKPIIFALLLGMGVSSMPLAALADPPDWAPAHGWRDQQQGGGDYRYEHRRYHDDGRYEHRNRDGGRYEERHEDMPWRYQKPVRRQQITMRECQQQQQQPDQSAAMLNNVIGGVVGGLLGSSVGKGDGRTAAVIGGVLLGAMLGDQLGTQLGTQVSEASAECMQRTFNQAKPGTEVSWHDPDHNSNYKITPIRDIKENNGLYCREYQADVSVGGDIRQSYGKACRQPDGSWKIMN
ncbi:MAG: RT0821/Lpp0805 family surface protein [Alphaproteobacteria bacterium]